VVTRRLIYFTPDEERVVRLLCAFAASAPRAPSASSTRYGQRRGPRILDVLHARDARAQNSIARWPSITSPGPTSLDWSSRCSSTSSTAVTYLIARGEGTPEIKGLPLSVGSRRWPGRLAGHLRIRRRRGRGRAAWRRSFRGRQRRWNVVVTTNENYADLLVRQYPGSLSAIRGRARSKSDSVLTVPGPRFDSSWTARIAFDCSRRSR